MYTIKKFVEVFNVALVITLIVFVFLLLAIRLYFFIQDELDAKIICVSGSSTWEDGKHSSVQELEIKKPVALIRRSPGFSDCEIAWLSPSTMEPPKPLVIQSKMKLRPGERFTVRIVRTKTDNSERGWSHSGAIGVGLATQHFADAMPGWGMNSIGFSDRNTGLVMNGEQHGWNDEGQRKSEKIGVWQDFDEVICCITDSDPPQLQWHVLRKGSKKISFDYSDVKLTEDSSEKYLDEEWQQLWSRGLFLTVSLNCKGASVSITRSLGQKSQKPLLQPNLPLLDFTLQVYSRWAAGTKEFFVRTGEFEEVEVKIKEGIHIKELNEIIENELSYSNKRYLWQVNFDNSWEAKDLMAPFVDEGMKRGEWIERGDLLQSVLDVHGKEKQVQVVSENDPHTADEVTAGTGASSSDAPIPSMQSTTSGFPTRDNQKLAFKQAKPGDTLKILRPKKLRFYAYEKPWSDRERIFKLPCLENPECEVLVRELKIREEIERRQTLQETNLKMLVGDSFYAVVKPRTSDEDKDSHLVQMNAILATAVAANRAVEVQSSEETPEPAEAPLSEEVPTESGLESIRALCHVPYEKPVRFEQE